MDNVNAMQLHCKHFFHTLTRQGFSLVEVTIAMGIMSFCLLAMLGMLPVGLNQERKATDQFLALQALSALAADFQNTPSGNSETPFYKLSVPAPGASSLTDWHTLSLDENLTLRPNTNNLPQAYEAAYKMEVPASKFGSYTLTLRISKNERNGTSTNASIDSVESVIKKSAM
ncbi:MAG: prepilin-type N-terminal cleavage/methylation domain-containing protein [Chthoniobacterales bacterium]